MNNDNRLDLVVVNHGTDEIGIFYNFDYVSFHDQVTYSSNDNRFATKMVVRDLNNDHHLDIAVLFSKSDSFGVVLGYGNGSFTEMIIYSIERDSLPRGIDAGDLNNDTWTDIIVTNTNYNSINIFFGYGDGIFAPMMTYSTGDRSYPTDIGVGDCNNDHRLDIIVVNHYTHSIGVLLGYGNGTFSMVKTYLIEEDLFPYSISVGDFNNDGNLDVVVANYITCSMGVLLGYGDGRFEKQWTLFTDGYLRPFCLSVNDFNSDNHLDIAIADWNYNSVSNPPRIWKW